MNNPNQQPHKFGSVPVKTAKYVAQVASIYRGNPLIEALPAQPNEEELWNSLEFHPDFRPADRKAPAGDRLQMVESLKFFFQPLKRHVGLAQSIFKMIRVGYAARNPAWGKQLKNPAEGAMESAALLGSSGIGKTQSVRHVLKALQGQIIHHSQYNGHIIDETQVLWLHVECPHDASPRGLCITFFEKMDQLLGTRYSSAYGASRASANTMIPGLVTVAREHYLGLLVIDEVQNLFTHNSRASKELKNFIVRLINDVGIPVLMVGTARTASMLSGSFRVNRRCTGLQEPFWDRLKKTQDEWETFMEELWNYRYVAREGDNYEQINAEMFELTQGIPDLAVKLFYLAQVAAINNGTDKLTVGLLRQITEKALVLNQRHLDDLRAGRIPNEEYQYEQVWNQSQFSLPATAAAESKKTGKKPSGKPVEPPAIPVNAPLVNLLGVQDGESVYDSLKRQGNVHNGKMEEVAA